MEEANLSMCLVCGELTQSCAQLYGVEGVCKPCGLFFGRYAGRDFSCTDLDHCLLFGARHQLVGSRHSIARSACKSCRMAKCLEVGMRKKNKDSKSQASDQIAAPGVPNDASTFGSDLAAQTAQTLSSLAATERQLQAFFAEDRQFSDAFLGQFFSLQEMLAKFKSSFTNTDTFLVKTQPPAPVVEKEWRFMDHTPHPHLMEIFGMIDLFRAMPAAARLDLSDQVTFLNEIGATGVGMLRHWRSAGCQSEVILYGKKRANLLEMFQTHSNYRGNATIQFHADYIYRRTQCSFNAPGMSEEEYLLLRAVVLSHSAISGLSRHAQSVLQAEAERYSRLLLHLVQSRMGGLEGAQRYAALVHVAECGFHGTHKYRQFLNYMAVVAEQGHFHAAMPRPFQPMMLQGSSDTNAN